MRPPSNPRIGKRLRKANTIELIMKKFQNGDARLSKESNTAVDNRLIAGPAAAIIISETYDPIPSCGFKVAPSEESVSEEKRTRKIFAMKICPSSCRNAASKPPSAYNECVAIMANNVKRAKKPILIFICCTFF